MEWLVILVLADPMADKLLVMSVFIMLIELGMVRLDCCSDYLSRVAVTGLRLYWLKLVERF